MARFVNVATPCTAGTDVVLLEVKVPGPPLAARLTVVVSPVSTLPYLSSMETCTPVGLLMTCVAMAVEGSVVKTSVFAAAGVTLKLCEVTVVRLSPLSPAASV